MFVAQTIKHWAYAWSLTLINYHSNLLPTTTSHASNQCALVYG